MSTNYDVAIIGAGPAGGFCAKELAKKGFKVLIIDKLANPTINAYSSGGAPIEILSNFDLPVSLVSNYLNKFTISSSKNTNTWISEENYGVILDFAKLRAYFSETAKELGASVHWHTDFISYCKKDNKYQLTLKNLTSQTVFLVTTTIIIDASGTDRKLFGKKQTANLMPMTGIEYFIKVDNKIHNNFNNNLTFLIGQQWMPQGYGWVFPANAPYLKVGVIRYFANQSLVPHEHSYKFYIENIITQKFNQAEVTLRHGKTIDYAMHQNDIKCEHNIFVIGDAISSVNPLACEGIRHALATAQIACSVIANKGDSTKYQMQLKKYFRFNWLIMEKIMQYIYTRKNDEDLEDIFYTFKKLSLKEITDLGFNYKLLALTKFSWAFFLNKIAKIKK